MVLPEANLVLPTTLLVLASTAPLFFVKQSTPGKRHPRLRIRVALAYVLSILLAVAMARFALFDIVQFLLAARPNEGILLGSLLLLAAIALAPFVMTCYSQNQTVVRSMAILVMTGALLILMQPPLPIHTGARCPKLPLSLCPRLWDERHIPMHNSEDVEVWGRGLSRQEHWPRWFLIAATVMGMCASMLGGDITRSKVGRAVLSLVAGFLVGSYTALELVPSQAVLQIMVIIATMLVVIFVVGLQLPSAKGSVFLPFIGFAWFIVFGLTMLLQNEIVAPEPKMRRLFPDSEMEVNWEVYMAVRAGLLGIFAAHALLFAFVLKLRTSAALRLQDDKLTADGHDDNLYSNKIRGMPVAELFCGMVPSKAFAHFGGLLRMDGSGAVALQRLHREGLAWVPTAGNIFTITAMILTVSVNMYLTGGSCEAILMLAPLLLLLSQDPIFFSELNDHQRYFPSVIMSTAFLSITALSQTLSSLGVADFGMGSFALRIENPGIATSRRNGGATECPPEPAALAVVNLGWNALPGYLGPPGTCVWPFPSSEARRHVRILNKDMRDQADACVTETNIPVGPSHVCILQKQLKMFPKVKTLTLDGLGSSQPWLEVVPMLRACSPSSVGISKLCFEYFPNLMGLALHSLSSSLKQTLVTVIFICCNLDGPAFLPLAECHSLSSAAVI
eukprot:gene21509-28492_t